MNLNTHPLSANVFRIKIIININWFSDILNPCGLLAGKLLFQSDKETRNERRHPMIDFIIAAALYLALMFVLFFCLSFVTIGITYATAAFVRRCVNRFRSPDLALK